MDLIKINEEWLKLPLKRDDKTLYNKDKIILIQQFFKHSDNFRNKEICYCLKKNYENDYIDEIILLNERIYSEDEIGFKDELSKIKQININTRLTYKIVIDYVKQNNLIGYIIISNSDIYLDNSIKNIFSTSLFLGKCWYAQLRYEAYTKKIWENGKIGWSQDTWIYHTNCSLKNTDSIDFTLGRLGCDNVIALELIKNGIYIFNDPNYIKTWHLHKTENRDYKREDTLKPPWLIIEPVDI